MYECNQKDVKKALSEISKIRNEITDLPKDGEQVQCKTLLFQSEAGLTSSTTFFAVQIPDGRVFLVTPHGFVPKGSKIIRTTKQEPVRQKVQTSG
ncbi:MAG: hypothetical protein KGI08_07595 [Thaumarchaeota archaeon]|nr:hypothetical protein [Nitrososphaerota archaeon]